MVATQERAGGATIVLEVSLQSVGGGTTAHIEGYTTGRGYPWKGKEYEFLANALAVAGIPRKRGLELLSDLESYLHQLGAAVPSPPPPLAGPTTVLSPPTADSSSPALDATRDARRAKDRTATRRFAVVAYSGLALVFLGLGGNTALNALGDHATARALEILPFFGILLVAVGGFGLLGLANRQMRRPIGPSSSPPSSLTAFYGSVPWTPPEPPSLPAGDLAPSRSFDLSATAAAYHKRMRSAVLLRQGMYVFLVGLGVASLVASFFTGRVATGVVLGGFLIAFGLILSVFLRQIDAAPIRLTVDAEGLQFEYPNAKRIAIRWTDENFGLRLSATSAEVNRNLDPPVEGPSFSLFTGTGSGVGRGPRVLTELPKECFDLVLQRAQIAGLPVQPQAEGAAGTITERLTYRILPLSQRGFGP